MGKSKLFEPIHIGSMELKHRVAMAPLTRFRAGEDHVQLPMAVEYYTQRACTPGTFIIAEATMISPTHGGVPFAPGLWNDAQIEGWKRITEAVHAKDCRIFCQLFAPGRTASPAQLQEEGYHELLSSSPVPMPTDSLDSPPNPTPRAMTEEEIRSCIADFARAAKNSIAAGFDGVEIHGANGYLVDQFLQDTCNQRSDSWGGSVENRARFAIEVATAVSEAIGAERLGWRVSPWSPFQGMCMQDPVPQFSYLVSKLKELNLGYLHIIESRVINNIDREKSEGIEFLLDIWGKKSPVLVAGGYTPENCFTAVDEEYKEYEVVVVFGRHFISNPDLVYRIKNDVPLNKYDRATFYEAGTARGYIDYPFSDGFKSEAKL
ncbi:NADH:flavin oxidoreductase/NADH oxidase [Corynespora cassiicola Philippines]|uniref:NADH:flavin oxidoreductase/NADH oxidase n=1 Tax=Corynespora cassiicola Philippines TaxID=1448308 RepID=A0A2T2P7U2_CORCC|nr:NADH:flavin oxidoreductase/NADH oxidase [Corynespora cassiicola Philippines]